MEQYIAFDSHKRYTWVEHWEANTGKVRQYRVEHAPGAIREALAGCAAGTAVAIEATANWYWITEEIEQAQCVPRLVHPRKAKLMMGQVNKSDKLDTHGMNVLQRNGTLPTAWIPPGPLRELRELTRTRVVLVAQRTRWKNRITATLAKWGLPGERVQRCIREEGARRDAGTAGEIAGTDALGDRADVAATGRIERADSGVREAFGRVGGGYTGNAVAVEFAGSGSDIVGDDRVGDRRDWKISERRTAGVVCGHGAACALERRSHAVRADAARCESLSEMGFCRSWEFHGGEPPAIFRTSCESVVRAIAREKRAQHGGGRGGAAFGGSRFPCAEPPTGVSRSGSSGSDQIGVNAKMS